jgi:putative nucleotidyltransferase with HDIG domain
MTPLEQNSPLQNVVHLFRAARNQTRLLPPEHPSVVRAVREFLEKLEEPLRSENSVTISILGGEMYLDGHLLASESIAYADMAQELADRNLDGMVFSRGLTLDELTRFFALTNLQAEELTRRGGWKAALEQEGVRHVGTDRVVGLAESTPTMQAGREMYHLCLDAIVESFSDARKGHFFNVQMIQQRVKTFTSVLLDDPQVFHNLSTIKDKDQYTFYHSVNVAVLSLLIGYKLKLEQPLLEVVGTAAILHDVGKMRIPDDILNKPDGLSKNEWTVMQSHTVEGAKILLQSGDPQALPMVVAAQHHAEHTLGGYPDFPGLGRLHMLTEIVSVADMFDALTSDRAYRKAMPPDQAIKLIAEGSGKRFHPTLVKVFAQLSGLYPIGTVVELDTGELAVVVRPNSDDLYRPSVRIVPRVLGTRVDPGEVQLSEKNSKGFKRSIVRSIDPDEHGLQVPPLVSGAGHRSP